MTGARAWVEDVVIPTYLVGLPDRNPMFLEKRVYQGSSGRVYPYPIIDRLSDEPVDEQHRVIRLENRYLDLMIMPAFGGRIQYGYDKTNGYAFIYHNRVIKPALVGLTGPWLSGGIEFNWPQHHRPGTYCPVDYTITESPDGSATVWLSEIEPMYHLKGTLALTLRPDRAYLEIAIRFANPTPLPQSVHLWTNPAVHVNDDYQSVFPPDVQAVYDHGKRDVSTFPIARGTYYKVDYSPGVDISWYRNIPVPTSFMAASSRYDFMGGYDHGRHAGLLHVADHHVVPGKKQWVWGAGEFGRAWDRNLTDEDGPYAELMCGVFADNQPDFSWLQPYEEREARQYFLPYKAIGYVRNATIDAALSFDIHADGAARIGVYATSEQPGAQITIRRCDVKGDEGERLLWSATCDLAPETPWTGSVPLPAFVEPHELSIEVASRDGRTLVAWTPEPVQPQPVPDPAEAIPEPAALAGADALYLAGLHLEQYHHATRVPEDYYEEGLRRDPADLRCNLALGRLLLRRGRFAPAERSLRAAVRSATRHNPNPTDGEPHYLLGLCLRYQDRLDEASGAFAKAAWTVAWRDAAFLELARLASRQGDRERALDFVERALVRNQHGQPAQHLRALLLRQLGREVEAATAVDDALRRDPLDFGARNERVLLSRQAVQRAATPDDRAHAPARDEQARDQRTWDEQVRREQASLHDLMRGDPHTHLEIAGGYAEAGAYGDALDLLQRAIDAPDPAATRAPGHTGPAGVPNARPMLFYMAAYYASLAGQPEAADGWLSRAATQSPDRCCPNGLDALLALEHALARRPDDARAALYLGNLWYDKGQVLEAAACWQQAARADDTLATAHRNLALAWFNKHGDATRARAALERAFARAPVDGRVLFELDLLKKRCGVPPHERLAFLRRHPSLVDDREALLVELITLLNSVGDHDEALRLLTTRAFHPWEGGEGKTTGQYVVTLIELAKAALGADRPGVAIDLLERARVYPANLGEGKLHGTPENEALFWMGQACAAAGWHERARAAWAEASTGLTAPAHAVFYNDRDPDSIFYQGLACARLDRPADARDRFDRLVAFGQAHLDEEVTIDYFAVSLPEFLVFDDDLKRRNEITCRHLIALGAWGLGDRQEAIAQLRTVLRLDPGHQAAARHLRTFTGRLAPLVTSHDPQRATS